MVEDDGGEALVAETFRERREPARLDGTEAVGHYHRRLRAVAHGRVQPGLAVSTGRKEIKISTSGMISVGISAWAVW